MKKRQSKKGCKSMKKLDRQKVIIGGGRISQELSETNIN